MLAVGLATLLLAGPAASPAEAAVTPTYVRDFAGPALADMYPVDISERNGDYYVVDPGRYRVVKIDGSTGDIVDQVGGHQGRDVGELGAARALSHDSSGRVYVADTANNRIQVYSEFLGYLASWGLVGTGAGQFRMPYGIATGMGKDAGGAPAEVAYVTDQAFRVQKFDLSGNFISQFGEGELDNPRQLGVHPTSRDVYVVSARNSEVVVFSEDGVKKFSFGSRGTGDGQFSGDPRGIAISDNGTSAGSDDLVFVSDAGNYRVQAFDNAGNFKFAFGKKGKVAGSFAAPRGLTVTDDGKIIVSDEWDFGLEVFQLDAARSGVLWVEKLFGDPAPIGGFNSPRGLAVDGSGRVYGVDWWNQRIQRFNPDGSGALSWGSRGTRTDGTLNFAWDVTIQPGTGRVFVANRESNEIEVFTADGGYVARWGSVGTSGGQFKFPHGLDFAPDGTLLVTDSGNNRIQRFTIGADGNGTWQSTYGSAGTGPGQFKVPTGVSVAPDGTIWVADTQNNRIQRRSPTGAWTTYSFTSGTTHIFKLPWGVTVAPDGSIWIADSGNKKVVKMTSTGSSNFALTGTAMGAGPLDGPFKIAFGPADQVYVSDTWNSRVVQLQI